MTLSRRTDQAASAFGIAVFLLDTAWSVHLGWTLSMPHMASAWFSWFFDLVWLAVLVGIGFGNRVALWTCAIFSGLTSCCLPCAWLQLNLTSPRQGSHAFQVPTEVEVRAGLSLVLSLVLFVYSTARLRTLKTTNQITDSD